MSLLYSSVPTTASTSSVHLASTPIPLKLTIAYEGTPYSGWQSQRETTLLKPAIQDVVEEALQKITGQFIGCHGAGRTDAGVHAWGQVAHIHLPTSSEPPQEKSSSFTLPPLTLQRALNAILPPTIRIMRAESVPSNFHARFSLHQKTYRYTIWHDDVLPPHYYLRAWHLYGKLDEALLHQTAQLLQGQHDFRAFTTPTAAKERHHTIRTLTKINITRSATTPQLLQLDFTGEGFLYHMVRMMTSAMILVARGKSSLSALKKRLTEAQNPTPQENHLAPACGLCLQTIQYT